MEVTSGPSAKRPRAKSKAPASQQNEKPTIVAKKPRGTRKAASAVTALAETATPAVTTAPPQPASEELEGMIATAAYFLAAERHFHPGGELDDWLEAERRIRSSFYG